MTNLSPHLKYYKNKAITAAPVIALFIFFPILTYFFHPEEAKALHYHWLTAGNISQGYLLMAAAAFLAVMNLQRSDFAKSNFLFAGLFIVALATFTIGKLAYIKLLSLPSIVLLWFFLCGALFGLQVAKKLRLATFIMLMAMPAWFIIQPLLQSLTVFFVSNIVSWLDLTTYIYKNYIEVPSGTIHVAGGCSGIKYFTSAISIALIASAINHRNFRSTMISVIIAATLSLFANWIRVLILVLYGYYEGIDHPLMADHDGMGWVIFAIVLAPWLYFDQMIPTHQHFKQNEVLAPFVFSKRAILAAIFLPLVTLYSLIGFIYSSDVTKPKEVKEAELQSIFPGWARINPNTESMFVVKSHDHAQIITNLNSCDSRKIGVFTFYTQSQNKEMVSSVNSIWNRDAWEIHLDESFLASENTHTIKHVKLHNASRPNTHLYYWYQIGPHFASTIWTGKFLQLINRIAENDTSRIFIISSAGPEKCQVTADELASYTAKLNKLYTNND